MTRKVKIWDAPVYQDKEYFDMDDLDYDLSFGADYTVLTSIRNLGKSYACMMKARSEIEKGHTILWERYNRDEYGISVKAWENFAPELEKGESKGYREYVHPESGGKLLLIQTSVATNIKGYDDVPDKLPVLEFKDEFLPVRYTNNNRFLYEYTEAMEIRKTFKRNGPMRSVYMSNCLNWLNPYTVAWQFSPVDTGKITMIIDSYTITAGDERLTDSRSILWHNVKPTKAQLKRVLRTEVSSMNVTNMDAYLDNEFYKEYSKIARCPEMSIQLTDKQLMSEGYYFSYRIYQGKYYFCQTAPRKSVDTYVSEKEYIDIDERHFRTPYMASIYEQAFNDGLCIFDSTKTFYAFQRWLINLRKRS